MKSPELEDLHLFTFWKIYLKDNGPLDMGNLSAALQSMDESLFKHFKARFKKQRKFFMSFPTVFSITNNQVTLLPPPDFSNIMQYTVYKGAIIEVCDVGGVISLTDMDQKVIFDGDSLIQSLPANFEKLLSKPVTTLLSKQLEASPIPPYTMVVDIGEPALPMTKVECSTVPKKSIPTNVIKNIEGEISFVYKNDGYILTHVNLVAVAAHFDKTVIFPPLGKTLEVLSQYLKKRDRVTFSMEEFDDYKYGKKWKVTEMFSDKIFLLHRRYLSLEGVFHAFSEHYGVCVVRKEEGDIYIPVLRGIVYDGKTSVTDLRAISNHKISLNAIAIEGVARATLAWLNKRACKDEALHCEDKWQEILQAYNSFEADVFYQTRLNKLKQCIAVKSTSFDFTEADFVSFEIQETTINITPTENLLAPDILSRPITPAVQSPTESLLTPDKLSRPTTPAVRTPTESLFAPDKLSRPTTPAVKTLSEPCSQPQSPSRIKTPIPRTIQQSKAILPYSVLIYCKNQRGIITSVNDHYITAASCNNSYFTFKFLASKIYLDGFNVALKYGPFTLASHFSLSDQVLFSVVAAFDVFGKKYWRPCFLWKGGPRPATREEDIVPSLTIDVPLTFPLKIFSGNIPLSPDKESEVCDRDQSFRKLWKELYKNLQEYGAIENNHGPNAAGKKITITSSSLKDLLQTAYNSSHSNEF